MERDTEGKSFPVDARERLERVFTDLSRQPYARIVQAARREGRARPERDRLQGALSRIGRAAPRAVDHQESPAAPADAAPGPGPASPVAPAVRTEYAAHIRSLVERLDRIEQVLADLRNPLRSATPTRDLFREWIRNGHWEEVRFGDYVRLRRAGLI